MFPTEQSELGDVYGKKTDGEKEENPEKTAERGCEHGVYVVRGYGNHMYSIRAL